MMSYAKPPSRAIAILLLALVSITRCDTAYGADGRSANTLDKNVRCLALAIYWEAREGGRELMNAVGWVVLNRRNNPDFPDSVCGVVHEGRQTSPCQFSYWCDGEPETPENADSWKLAIALADKLLHAPGRDPTHGALYFHSSGVSPPWTRDHKKTAKIGDMTFYR